MSIPNTGPMLRRPTHPGGMLREDFLPDYGLTVSGLAEAVGVSRQSINELIRGRRAVSPEMALRLSRLFGNSAEFWPQRPARRRPVGRGAGDQGGRGAHQALGRGLTGPPTGEAADSRSPVSIR